MGFFDKILGFGAGYRTELLAAAFAILRILASFGLIDPAKVEQIGNILLPVAGVTLANKITRGLK